MTSSGKSRVREAGQRKRPEAAAKIEPPTAIGENTVLSNRDKAQHSRERGLDSKRVQTDQLQDTVANRDSE